MDFLVQVVSQADKLIVIQAISQRSLSSKHTAPQSSALVSLCGRDEKDRAKRRTRKRHRTMLFKYMMHTPVALSIFACSRRRLMHTITPGNNESEIKSEVHHPSD